MKDIQKLLELKIEIETLKAKLRRSLDDPFNMDSIMELNYKIDELIVKYHRLEKD